MTDLLFSFMLFRIRVLFGRIDRLMSRTHARAHARPFVAPNSREVCLVVTHVNLLVASASGSGTGSQIMSLSLLAVEL
jgi:hypothetical protein